MSRSLPVGALGVELHILADGIVHSRLHLSRNGALHVAAVGHELHRLNSTIRLNITMLSTTTNTSVAHSLFTSVNTYKRSEEMYFWQAEGGSSRVLQTSSKMSSALVRGGVR